MERLTQACNAAIDQLDRIVYWQVSGVLLKLLKGNPKRFVCRHLSCLHNA